MSLVMRMTIPRTCSPDNKWFCFEWFQNNLSKSNAGKYHLLVSTNDRVSIIVAGCSIEKRDTKKLLGVNIICYI